MSGQRRAPWLSGLIVALPGAVWLCVEVVGGVEQLVAVLQSTSPSSTELPR